ncbi:unnamed protein product [Prorocentrum cordatum]|uniref:Uncharacterized protein n=1 Tax=Prorocentrum cordatum TaxID=2364126 RepID=A0ABN9PY49_9DINO|nr:unnamed protein product [Polarella glacialis]
MASASSSTSSLRGSAQMGGLRPFDRSDAPHGPCCATRLRHQVPAAEVGPSTAERGLGLHSAAADTWGYPELKNKKALAQPGARGAQRSTVPSDVCTYPQATALKRDAAHGGAPPWALMQPAARFGRHSWQEDLGRRRRIGAGRKRREEVRGCGVGGQGQIKRAPAGTPRLCCDIRLSLLDWDGSAPINNNTQGVKAEGRSEQQPSARCWWRTLTTNPTSLHQFAASRLAAELAASSRRALGLQTACFIYRLAPH